MSPNQIKLTQALAHQGQIDQELIALYGAKLALDLMLQRALPAAIGNVTWDLSAGPLTAEFNADVLQRRWMAGGREIDNLSRVQTAIAALEMDPKFAEAVATVAPLHAEIVRLGEQIEVDRLAYQAAHQAAEDAHKLATEKALVAAESDPQVVLARKALAAFDPTPEPEPAKPFRGAVKLKNEHVLDMI